MQQLNTIIDTVTDAKTNVLKTIVTEESFRKPLQEMVNAENEVMDNFEFFLDQVRIQEEIIRRRKIRLYTYILAVLFFLIFTAIYLIHF